MAKINRPARRDQRGHALLTSLLMMTALMPLGAFALMQVRTDLLVNRHVRAGAEAFSAAESGLELALADLRHDPSFDRLRVGADGTAGTADDRLFAFVAGPAVMLPAPMRYEIEVQPRTDELIDIVARGFGTGLSTRVVAATVRRGGVLWPAAICTAASPLDLVLGADFSVSGHDHAGKDTPLPALALSHDAAGAVRGTLSDVSATQLTGDGGPPSIATQNCPPVDSVASSFASETSARTVAPGLSGSLGSGVFLGSCLLYTSPSPRDRQKSRMPSSA